MKKIIGRMEKRGASHVEFILAFVIFAGFVIFALMFFSPAKSNRLGSSTLSYAISEIELAAETNVEVYSVSLNRGVISGATPAPRTISINLEDVANTNKIRAFNRTMNELPAKLRANDALIDWQGSDMVYLHLSKDIDNSQTQVSEPNAQEIAGSYKIAMSEDKKAISEKRVEEIIQKYDSDYKALKEEFNLPGRIDFSFKVVFSEQEVLIPSKEIEKGREVFNEKLRKEVVRSDGRIVFADLIVTVW